MYLRAMYPGCPDKMRRSLLKRARKMNYFGRLGTIAGILTSNSIRHELTDYESLMKVNGRMV
jgi:hypothetical protein